MLTSFAAWVPRCKQIEPTSDNPHLTCAQQYGSHLQGRCDTRYVVLVSPVTPGSPDARITTILTPISRRRRLPNHDRRIHRQPSDRQADPRPRHHLVLPIRLCRRHTSRRRHRAIPTGPVPHDERQDTHDPDRRGYVSGALLRKQGHVDVSLSGAWRSGICTGAAICQFHKL